MSSTGGGDTLRVGIPNVKLHASCVDYILHFKKYLFCRNSICL